MARHTNVNAKYDHNLKLDWKNKVQLRSSYVEYRNQFLRFLRDFQSMWDDHLGQMTIAKYCVELTDENTQLIKSTYYRAGPRVRALEDAMIDKMLLQKVIKPERLW